MKGAEGKDRDREGERKKQSHKEEERGRETAPAAVCSFEDTNLSDQGPSHMASFNLSYFL